MNKKSFRISSSFTRFGVVIALAVMTGCASTKHAKTAEDIEEIKTIQSIAILEIPEPLRYKFGEGILGTGSALFGVVGTMADMASFEQADAKDEYGNEFSFSTEMHKKIVSSLERNNIAVTEVEVTRNNRRQLIGSYADLPANVDAYLDIVPDAFIGYMSDGGTFDPDYYPILTASVRLVSAQTQEVLYANQYHYSGLDNPFLDVIEAPPPHIFETKDELFANKARAIDNLIKGVDILGTKILRDMSRDWARP